MKFLIDAQLPPALAEWLIQRGYEAKAVRSVGLRDAADRELWSLAEKDDWVIVTKDEDFAHMAAGHDQGPQVLWLRIGNAVNRVLFDWLEPLLPQVVIELRAGNRLVEVGHMQPRSEESP